jgi:hypothetical protein
VIKADHMQRNELYDAIKEYASINQWVNKHTGPQIKKIPDLFDFFNRNKGSANYIDVKEEYGLSSEH